MLKWVLLAVLLIALAGVGYWWARLRTYHFAVVDEGVLYRDGNRGVPEFANAIRRAKIRTVICLIDDGELTAREKPEFAAEMEWCRNNGVRVERMPIRLGGWPSSEDVKHFLDFVSDKNNQPVLVHCAQGVRRTGMIVAAYQQSVLGWDDAKTKKEILTFGHSQRTVGDVQKFIDVYDPKTHAVPSDLPVGQE